jgi:hypothetical protein
MNEQQVALTYEAITNPILRLLVYFLAAAVLALTGAVVYQYRDREHLMKEVMTINAENTKMFNALAAGIERMSEDLGEVRNQLFNYIIKK